MTIVHPERPTTERAPTTPAVVKPLPGLVEEKRKYSDETEAGRQYEDGYSEDPSNLSDDSQGGEIVAL
jgi:hypothetical protein